MITFANPRKCKMASGSNCLQLTEAGTWESFPLFAEKYVRQIGASVLAKIETPDMHLWEIEYSGATLNLVYEDFPNGVSIEPKDNRGQSAIDTLYSLAMEQKSQNGL
ncbi:DUF3630 domain-containing protein [Stutzerimonas stutzeri]|nr:DUF3630 domain-containing protein [Stutzerimonas stutzeri]